MHALALALLVYAGAGGSVEPRARCAACSLLPAGATGSDLTLSGNMAVAQGQKVCLNVSCSMYLTYDGTSMNFGLSNATYYAISNSTGVMTTPYTFTSSIASGSNAFGVLTNGARIDFGAGASDYASSDGTTVTFAGPIATSTITPSSTVTLGSNAALVNARGWNYNTAPTISSGFGTSPSIVNSNGTAAFQINVGTGGVAFSGVIGLPNNAGNGWVCECADLTTPGANLTRMTANSSSSCTVTNVAMSTGANAAWTASDKLWCTAAAD